MSKSGRNTDLLLKGSYLTPIILIIIYFSGFITVGIFYAWLSGWIIVFIGFVFELLFIKRGLVQSDKSFIRNVLGAISVRLLITVILVYICLTFLELNQNNFIFSTFIFYFFYLIIEIFYLNFRKY